MKKLLLLTVMALAGLTASAQFKSQPSVNHQTNTKTKMASMPQTKRTFQAVAPLEGLAKRTYVPTNKLTLDIAKMKPVTRAQRALASQPVKQTKALAKGQVQNRKMQNLKAMLTLNPQASTQAKASRKAPAFAEAYTGMGYDYETGESKQWTMTPVTETYTDEETGEEEVVNAFVGIIPTPEYLSELYPNGIPVEYTIDDNGGITIAPQAVANFEDEESGDTHYLTICSATSDDCTMTLELDESGKLTFTDGNWIMLAEFDGVEFDFDEDAEELGEAFLGYWELIANVAYYYHIETSVDQEYYGHGVDYFANQPADWVMQRGTTTMDDEVVNFFIDMIPEPELFSELYPNGIDVEYTQDGNTITVKPQLIASIDDEENPEYVILFSATDQEGKIILTVGEDGSLTTVEGESIIIGAWSTSKFDASYETYDGGYLYIENVKYRLPDAPAETPMDVACEPDELVLFAGLGYSGYSYNDNLAIMGAYAPTTFRNLTMDITTAYDWSVKEYGDDDEETTITSDKRNFTLNTKGGAVYEEFTLTAYNQDAASLPYSWGVGHAPNNNNDGPRYEAIHAYAGQGASAFQFSDGTYSVITRQNPDFDLTFYVNWGTPNYADQYNISRIATIYSYQGKPSTPLYLTGVTLPMVSFEPQEDFNLHIKLCKCHRSATGNLTLGDVIAESDATMDNVNADYDAGLTAVEFTELYTEDEFGMSEAVDYLFIEDEFVIVIEGWDNGTFSGVLGSQDLNFNENTSTWFQAIGETRLRSYGGGWPMLFIGLLDATYGYLHTEDDTNLIFAKEGGTSSIHVDPMYYSTDEETEEPTYDLYIESILVDGEEVEEIPEWLTVEVANEDYTTATGIDDDGEEYEYFVNGIDYDLVFTTEALPEGVENRTCQIVYFQTGAKLTVTVTQDIDPDGINTIVEKTPIKNSRAYNLAGQPVGKNHKGIVVKDGKKVVIK